MLICLVGGAVRDMLLGREVADRDFLVLGATRAEFLRRFPGAREVGRAFPVFLVDGEEFAFPRSLAEPRACCGFGGGDVLNDLAADLAARDLTVNALALPLPDFPALPAPEDAWGLAVGLDTSLADLDGRILRPAGPKALDLDPLRIFRAARFTAQFPDFAPHPDLREAMAAAAPLATNLSAERVGAELRKALRSPAPGRFLRTLAATGCLAPWFAELEQADSIPAGPEPHHDCSVLEHTARIMDALAAQELPCWMALCHDLGKTATPADRLPAHHGHEALGAPLAEALGRRLALPERFIRAGELAARLHMQAARYPELRPGTRVDLLADLHAQRLTRELFALVAADSGRDHAPQALADLAAMLRVHLPEDQRGLGRESGRRLRELRCQALASLPGEKPCARNGRGPRGKKPPGPSG